MCVRTYVTQPTFIKDIPKHFKLCIPAFTVFTVYLTVGKKHAGGEEWAERWQSPASSSCLAAPARATGGHGNKRKKC